MQVLRVFKKPNVVKAICQLRRIFIFLAHNVLFIYFLFIHVFIYCCCKCYGLDTRKCSIPITFCNVTYLGKMGQK